jgi:hypothetical protein
MDEDEKRPPTSISLVHWWEGGTIEPEYRSRCGERKRSSTLGIRPPGRAARAPSGVGRSAAPCRTEHPRGARNPRLGGLVPGVASYASWYESKNAVRHRLHCESPQDRTTGPVFRLASNMLQSAGRGPAVGRLRQYVPRSWLAVALARASGVRRSRSAGGARAGSGRFAV